MAAQHIRVGCSGWQYKHWRADFYPTALPVSRWFPHYALQFDTVEINNSFYRLPPPETFAKWREQAPRRFIYAVKASRFLTHLKKLKDPDDPLARFFEAAVHLGPHLGPVLYQLPPGWKVDVPRLERFLAALDTVPAQVLADADARQLQVRLPFRHVIEFREASWYDARVYELLQKHRVALCLHDMQGSATERMVIGPFVYVRFYGWTKYGGRYEDERLDEWAGWLAQRIVDGLDVFAYFNNDIGGHAPRDAVRLRDRIHVRLDAARAGFSSRTAR